jgi:hypothetical protein
MGLHKLLFFLAVLIYGSTVFAKGNASPAAPKDTLLMMDGSKFTGELLDTANHKYKVRYFKKSGKEKTVSMDDDLIFSVLYHDGHEQIVYKQDTTTGNFFSAEETRFFLYGERDAEQNYHCPGSTISSFVLGVGCGYIGSFFSLIPPFVYSGLLLIPKIKVKYTTVSNPVYLNYETYVMGYEKIARRKKLFRSLVSGVGGLAGGLVAFQLIFTKI